MKTATTAEVVACAARRAQVIDIFRQIGSGPRSDRNEGMAVVKALEQIGRVRAAATTASATLPWVSKVLE